jgi:hypothetical protein
MQMAQFSWGLVAPTSNPSHSGGRDQGESRFKARQGKQFERPYMEKPFTKNRADGVSQSIGPEFKIQYYKKKKSLNLSGEQGTQMLVAVKILDLDFKEGASKLG